MGTTTTSTCTAMAGTCAATPPAEAHCAAWSGAGLPRPTPRHVHVAFAFGAVLTLMGAVSAAGPAEPSSGRAPGSTVSPQQADAGPLVDWLDAQTPKVCVALARVWRLHSDAASERGLHHLLLHPRSVVRLAAAQALELRHARRSSSGHPT